MNRHKPYYDAKMRTGACDSVKNTLNISIIGHSFVRRLASNLSKQRLPGMTLDKSMPSILRLDDHIKTIQTVGKSGLKISDLVCLIDEVGQSKPDAIIIDCGSNDLTLASCNVEQLVENLMSLANYSKIVYEVKLVMFCSVLPRGKCREVTPLQFEERMKSFNSKLQESCANESGTCFFMYRGFWRDPTGNVLPISAWSSDLIHPGVQADSKGFLKYVRNIRDCLQTIIAMLRSETETSVR